MRDALQELKTRLSEIDDLRAAGAVLAWDQMTGMPPGGAAARGRQLSTLGRLAHERFTDPAIGRLLDHLQPYADGLPYDSDDASLIRVTRRSYEHATRLPSAFVAKTGEHFAAIYEAWHQARPANDFSAVHDSLARTLEYSREFSAYFPGYAHIADPLVDPHNTGLKTAEIRGLFTQLRVELVPLVRAIGEQPAPDDACLHALYPKEQQLVFAREMAAAFGFDFSRGRLDLTPHPFMTDFAIGDVRIATRVNERDLTDALFSTLHEAGHGMYGQGIALELEGTPLAYELTGDIHESQSRLWENVVGRSRACWEHWYPRLQTTFPAQLGDVPLEMYYRAINKVSPSLIRTDADEVTYNLHVMIRFDLELDLLEGKLTIADLPEAWRTRYREDLGVAPPDDRDGVLQDVHWYGGFIGGAFHGYTLGNILCAQFYGAALQAHSGIPEESARGEYGALRGWLTEQIYRHGAKFTTNEIVWRATGSSLTIEPYMRYLRGKYGELYGV